MSFDSIVQTLFDSIAQTLFDSIAQNLFDSIAQTLFDSIAQTLFDSIVQTLFEIRLRSDSLVLLSIILSGFTSRTGLNLFSLQTYQKMSHKGVKGKGL